MVLELPTRRTRPELWARPRGHRGHVPQPANPRPMNGGPGGLGWVPPGLRSQAGGGGSFIVQNGVYVPLAGVSPADPLSGGYGFCDWTGDCPHPGVDWNAGPSCGSDEGAAVVASVAGVVVAVLPWDQVSQGEGNHAWILYDAAEAVAPAWCHYDHLAGFAVAEGERVEAGQQIGWCSGSGGWPCAHLHHELARQQPSSWWQWPVGWSVAQVQSVYFDPGWWLRATAEQAGQMGGGVPMDVTPEQLEAVKPYFEQLGVACNTQTAIYYRAALAYYRDETRGPATTGEYPATAPDGVSSVRQNFTAGVAEWRADTNAVSWVEVVTQGVTAP
jgi:hypothetical protein